MLDKVDEMIIGGGMAFTFRIHWLEVMGKHALIIYLTHQVVLFGLVSFVYYLLN